MFWSVVLLIVLFILSYERIQGRFINLIRGFSIVVFLIVSCVLLISNTIKKGNIKVFLALLVIFLIMSGFILIVKVIKKITIKHLSIDYIRDLPKEYSLPVMAFLYNKNINHENIIMALKIKFKRLNVDNNVEELKKLSPSEKFVYDMLKAEKNEGYSFSILNDVIAGELEDENLIGKEITNISLLIFIALILFIGTVFAIFQISGNPLLSYDEYLQLLGIGIVFLAGCLILQHFSLKSKTLQYNLKGKQEHKKVLGFYNFLKDFTNLDEKTMQEYPLWEEYLEYAVLFNINNNYKYKRTINNFTSDEVFDRIEKIGEGISKKDNW